MQKSVGLRIYLSTVYDTYHTAQQAAIFPFSIVHDHNYPMILLLLLDSEVGPELTSGNTDASGRVDGVAIEA
jgi:hypothetical protein